VSERRAFRSELVCCNFLWRRPTGSQQVSGQRQARNPKAIGQKAEVTDKHETFGQHVNAARRRLRDLIQLYVSNMDDGHTRVKMDEVDRHIDDTWFGWIGSMQNDNAFYYQVQSLVILIEFDHRRPANLAKFAANPKMPTQQHIHCVVRTPNGNDYWKDLLMQHYFAHPHT
jgi:hypothetical protein